MKLTIHPGAAADIQEEAQYYEEREFGLGMAFLHEVDSAVDTVLSMPQAFPPRRANLRMYVFSRFPFSMLYRLDDNALEILVVRHHSRDENYGMERL